MSGIYPVTASPTNWTPLQVVSGILSLTAFSIGIISIGLNASALHAYITTQGLPVIVITGSLSGISFITFIVATVKRKEGFTPSFQFPVKEKTITPIQTVEVKESPPPTSPITARNNTSSSIQDKTFVEEETQIVSSPFIEEPIEIPPPVAPYAFRINPDALTYEAGVKRLEIFLERLFPAVERGLKACVIADYCIHSETEVSTTLPEELESRLQSLNEGLEGLKKLFKFDFQELLFEQLKIVSFYHLAYARNRASFISTIVDSFEEKATLSLKEFTRFHAEKVFNALITDENFEEINTVTGDIKKRLVEADALGDPNEREKQLSTCIEEYKNFVILFLKERLQSTNLEHLYGEAFYLLLPDVFCLDETIKTQYLKASKICLFISKWISYEQQNKLIGSIGDSSFFYHFEKSWDRNNSNLEETCKGILTNTDLNCPQNTLFISSSAKTYDAFLQSDPLANACLELYLACNPSHSKEQLLQSYRILFNKLKSHELIPVPFCSNSLHLLKKIYDLPIKRLRAASPRSAAFILRTFLKVSDSDEFMIHLIDSLIYPFYHTLISAPDKPNKSFWQKLKTAVSIFQYSLFTPIGQNVLQNQLVLLSNRITTIMEKNEMSYEEVINELVSFFNEFEKNLSLKK